MTRLKASALYMVIIIALVIGVICSSLIVSAYYYRLQYQKQSRYTMLQNNVSSAVNILVAGQDTGYYSKTFSLFNGDADSVSIQKIFWGAYDVGIAQAFIQKDTLYKTFSIANTVDSAKWAAIYLKDDQRPLDLSGKTTIRGDAFIPPAGVNQAYVNNVAYTGDKQLITGTKHNSDKTLPPLDSLRLIQFKELIAKGRANDVFVLKTDSLYNSFLVASNIINLGGKTTLISNTRLCGNIILFSDTSLTIDSTVRLSNVMIFAKSITVKSGFKGLCQLFATDSICIEPRCNFSYPSCLGILRFKPASVVSTQEKISLQKSDLFNGLIFTYEKGKTTVLPLIQIGSNVKVKGQIYSQGYLQFNDNAEVDGSVFTDKFLYHTTFTVYENYIVNTTINEQALSRYYLSSEMIPVASQTQKVLQWIAGN